MSRSDAERLRVDMDALLRGAVVRAPDDAGEPDTVIGYVIRTSAWSPARDPETSDATRFYRTPRWWSVQVIRILFATPPTVAEIAESGSIEAANLGRAQPPYEAYTVGSGKYNPPVVCTRLNRYWCFTWEGL